MFQFQNVINCMTLLVFLFRHNTVDGFTCSDVLEMPENIELSMYDLQKLQTKEIIACLPHLGRKELSTSVAEFIWHSIIEYHDGVSNVPENVLMQLGWVTIALKPDEYANLTFSCIDVVRNFGREYNLNDLQLSAIAARVQEDFASKEPEDYTFFDLSALGQILCAFNRSEIERIHPSAYREAAVMIGKLKRCSSDVMKGFAALAVQKGAFGSPEKWTKSVLTAVGQVFNYLPKNVGNKIVEDSSLIIHNSNSTSAEPRSLSFSQN